MTDQFQYCLDQLKRFDHDRYLAILLTPQRARAPLCALYAFDSEMARIPHSVSEPMLGEIRYQWWRETLEKMKPGDEPPHEIAGALCATFSEGNLDPSTLIPLIDKHAVGLNEEPFERLDDLVSHVGEVRGSVVELACQLVGRAAEYESEKDRIAKVTTAYGIVSHIRKIPVDASHLRLGLPLDLMSRYEIDPHDVFAAIVRPGLLDALNELLDRARSLYEDACQPQQRMGPDLMAILLPASLTPIYARRLSRPNYDLFRHSSEIPAFRRQVRYLRVRRQRHL